MRSLTAIRNGHGGRSKLLLALLAAAVVFTSGVGSASATDGSFEKKLQKGIDLCFSQGGGLDMDPPFTLDCGFANPIAPGDAAEADRFCHGQLHGDLSVSTGELFPHAWHCAYRPPKSAFP